MGRYRKIFSDWSMDAPLHETRFEDRKDDKYSLYDPECVELFMRDYYSSLKEEFDVVPMMMGVWIEDEEGNEVFSGDAGMV